MSPATPGQTAPGTCDRHNTTIGLVPAKNSSSWSCGRLRTSSGEQLPVGMVLGEAQPDFSLSRARLMVWNTTVSWPSRSDTRRTLS